MESHSGGEVVRVEGEARAKWPCRPEVFTLSLSTSRESSRESGRLESSSLLPWVDGELPWVDGELPSADGGSHFVQMGTRVGASVWQLVFS